MRSTYLKMSILTKVGLNSAAQGPIVIRIRYSVPTLTYLNMSVLTRVGLNFAAQRPAVIRIKRTNLDLPEDVSLDKGWLELCHAETSRHQDKVHQP